VAESKGKKGSRKGMGMWRLEAAIAIPLQRGGGKECGENPPAGSLSQRRSRGEANFARVFKSTLGGWDGHVRALRGEK